MASREFRHIVRIAGKDVDGTLTVNHAIASINGIGITLANIITRKANISPQNRIGNLTEIDVEKVQNVINNLPKHGFPLWMLNRQKNLETGIDTHLIGSDLTLRIKTDIEQMKNAKSWRGFRHAYGLRVRGQHTKTTGRKGKAMGVRKKTVRREARR